MNGNEKLYRSFGEFWDRHPELGKAAALTNNVLTGLIYLVYPAMLLVLFVRGDQRLLRCILVPGISFVILSAVRRRLGWKRPYEVYGGKPLIEKESKGDSFPSRHVFSVFMIGMTGFYLFPPLGAVIFLIGVIMAVIRVTGGVHFIRDVLAGAAAGIVCGLIGFWLFG